MSEQEESKREGMRIVAEFVMAQEQDDGVDGVYYFVIGKDVWETQLSEWGIPSLRQQVIDTFKEYGGWWKVEGMVEWLDTDVEKVRKVYDELEREGLMDRQRGNTSSVSD